MQPRFAALLFALGLVDLAYVNIGLGSEVFSDTTVPSPEVEPPRPIDTPAPLARPPSLPTANAVPELAQDAVTRNNLPPAIPPAPPPPNSEASPTEDPPAPGAPEPALAPSHAGAAPPQTAVPEPEPTDLVASLPASDLTVSFPDTATALLTPRAREELLALAARLRDHPDYRIHIVGHADARGSREFNLSLGGRRARVVSELLARAGVSREQIEALSRGEDEPRAIGAGERAWAANRRVEITIGSERSETP